MNRIRKKFQSIVGLALFVFAIQCLAEFQPGMTVVAQDRVSLESEKVNEYFQGESKEMLITGQLTGNAEEGFESIIVQCVITTPYRHSQSRTIEMGKDGSFRIAMDSPIPYQDIYLRVGDCYSTGLIVKDGMHLELNWEKLQASSVQLGVGDGVKYSGNDAAMNQFLCEYRVSSLEAMTKERDRVFEASRMQRLPADELLVVLNDVLEKGRERNKEYLANQPESVQGFAWMLEEESLNSYYGDVLIGFIGREIPDEVWQECISHQPVMLSASSVSYYHNFVLCLGQPMLAELHDYVVETLEGKIADEDREEFEAYVKCFVDARNGREYDKELFQRGGQKFMVSNTEAFQKARLACFAKRVQHVPKSKRGVMMLMGAGQRGGWSKEEFVDLALSQMNPGWCRSCMEAEFAKDQTNKSKLENAFSGGEKSVELGALMLATDDGAKLYYADHKSSEELAVALRKSFPGKAIILDMWATSCGSCIEDMKNSSAVKDKLAELPVEVVYLCFESQYETWMQTVAQMGVPGHHVFLPEKLSSDSMEFFEFTAFPNFLFIDLDGEVDSELITVLSSIDMEGLRKKLNLPAKDKGKE